MIRMGSLFVCRQSHQAPTIIVILINPPFFEKKGVFRFIAGLYLLLLALATYFWLQP